MQGQTSVVIKKKWNLNTYGSTCFISNFMLLYFAVQFQIYLWRLLGAETVERQLGGEQVFKSQTKSLALGSAVLNPPSDLGSIPKSSKQQWAYLLPFLWDAVGSVMGIIGGIGLRVWRYDFSESVDQGARETVPLLEPETRVGSCSVQVPLGHLIEEPGEVGAIPAHPIHLWSWLSVLTTPWLPGTGGLVGRSVTPVSRSHLLFASPVTDC